jgi:hypothetical protein
MSGTEYYPLLSCHYEKDSVSWVRYPYGCEEVVEGISLTPWSRADHPVGEEGITTRAAIGYHYRYDGEVFYLGLALDERNVRGSLDRPARTMREVLG